MESSAEVSGNIKFSLKNRRFLLFISVVSILTVYIFLSIFQINTHFDNFLSGYFSKEPKLEILRENITKEVLGNKLVTKVIDGDTIIVEGGYIIRLLGIDADENGYPCYLDAKKRLEELVLNKDIYLEADKKDKDEYKRYLRYVFINGENVNIKLIREGLVIARISDESEKYKNEIIRAERYAIENKIGCKWNIELKKEDVKIEINLTTTTIERIEKTTISSKISTTTLSTTTTIKNYLTTTSTIEYKRNTNELEEIDACEAFNYLNEEKTVFGKVVGTYRSKTNTIFLNFGKAYPNHCFSAVIFSYSLSKFPTNPEKYYYGKTVKIRGNITEYGGKPQIVLKNPNQIEIVE